MKKTRYIFVISFFFLALKTNVFFVKNWDISTNKSLISFGINKNGNDKDLYPQGNLTNQQQNSLNNNTTQQNNEEIITHIDSSNKILSEIPETTQKEALAGYTINDIIKFSKNSNTNANSIQFSASTLAGNTSIPNLKSPITHNDERYMEFKLILKKTEKNLTHIEYEQIGTHLGGTPALYYKIKISAILHEIITNVFQKSQDNQHFSIFSMILNEKPYCAFSQNLSELRGFINQQISQDINGTGICFQTPPIPNEKSVTEKNSGFVKQAFLDDYKSGTKLFFALNFHPIDNNKNLVFEIWLPGFPSPEENAITGTKKTILTFKNLLYPSFYTFEKAMDYLQPFGSYASFKKIPVPEYSTCLEKKKLLSNCDLPAWMIEWYRILVTQTPFTKNIEILKNDFKTTLSTNWRVDEKGNILLLKIY